MRLIPSAGVLALCAAAQPASAQLIDRKDLSLSAALAIATGAMESCRAQGYTVSVAVVGRDAQLLVQLRGDGAPPHSIENSYRRAYTALTYRRPSGEIEDRVRMIRATTVHLSQMMAARGGLPIAVGDDTLGAVAVSGGPGGDKDEACAQAGLVAAAGRLK